MDHVEEQRKLVSKDLVMDKISQTLLHEQVLRFFCVGFFVVVGCCGFFFPPSFQSVVNTIFNLGKLEQSGDYGKKI